jgi:hypothetical protein
VTCPRCGGVVTLQERSFGRVLQCKACRSVWSPDHVGESVFQPPVVPQRGSRRLNEREGSPPATSDSLTPSSDVQAPVQRQYLERHYAVGQAQAIAALAIYLGIGVAQWLYLLLRQSLDVRASALQFALSLALAWLAWRGHRWVRWIITLQLTLLTGLVLASAMRMGLSSPPGAALAVVSLVPATALWFLNTGNARRFLSARKASAQSTKPRGPSLVDRIMGRRSFLWLELIPVPFRPTQAQAIHLETFREEHGIPHEVLAGRVLDSRVTTRRVQAATVDLARKQRPEASDHEIWRAVLAARAVPEPPLGWGWDSERISRVMRGITSFENLVSLIIETEDRIQPRDPDPSGLGDRIDEILSR